MALAGYGSARRGLKFLWRFKAKKIGAGLRQLMAADLPFGGGFAFRDLTPTDAVHSQIDFGGTRTAEHGGLLRCIRRILVHL